MEFKAKRDEIVAGGVAVAAFAASAQHIFHVCAVAGNPPLVAALHPAGIDGLIYIGIRAMQGGNKRAGGFAIAYGAVYSLAFNAASYGGLKMPVWALAACMPLAMFFAFLIVHAAPKPAAEPAPEVVAGPASEIVAEAEQITMDAVTYIPRPSETRTGRTDGTDGRGRVAKWDVEKAIRLMDEGRTNAEIASTLGDVGEKPVQRTRRALGLVRSSDATDAEIADTCGLSAVHVARVRAAVTG
jgi:hypothetical protein